MGGEEWNKMCRTNKVEETVPQCCYLVGDYYL